MAKTIPKEDLDSIQMPRLTSTHNCHYVAAWNDDGYEVLPIVQMFAKDSHIRFDEGDRAVSFYFRQDVLAYIRDRVVERFYSDGPRL
jgi:hypothetical protein